MFQAPRFSASVLPSSIVDSVLLLFLVLLYIQANSGPVCFLSIVSMVFWNYSQLTMALRRSTFALPQCIITSHLFGVYEMPRLNIKSIKFPMAAYTLAFEQIF